jgi:hypothetical protein
MPEEEDFLPFVRDLPKDSTSAKVKAKSVDPKAPKVAKPAVEGGAGGAQVAEGKLQDLKLDGK